MTASLLVPANTLPADRRPRIASLFGADFSALSITPSRADLAPSIVRLALARFSPWDADRRVDLSDWHIADHGDAGARTLGWDKAFSAIKDIAALALESSPFAIGVGGDHSVTWPIVSALAERAERVGVIQFDVHHDVRPLDDGPTNGTPIRGLLEAGAIAPSDIVQIGIHPLGNRRHLTEYCDQQGIRRYSLADVDRLGIEVICGQALQLLERCDVVHLTVDIDVLDRAFAPGTVAALPGGLSPATLVDGISRIVVHPAVRSMDVVEFDPSRDVSDATAFNVAHAVMNAMIARAQANPIPHDGED